MRQLYGLSESSCHVIRAREAQWPFFVSYCSCHLGFEQARQGRFTFPSCCSGAVLAAELGPAVWDSDPSGAVALLCVAVGVRACLAEAPQFPDMCSGRIYS